jgi:hypothetical protein
MAYSAAESHLVDAVDAVVAGEVVQEARRSEIAGAVAAGADWAAAEPGPV